MRYIKKGEFERALETVMIYKSQQKAELERIDFVLSGNYLSGDTLVKDVNFTSTTYRRLREVLPKLFNREWESIRMVDFKNTTYRELYELVNKSKSSIKNIESVCFGYGINLR